MTIIIIGIGISIWAMGSAFEVQCENHILSQYLSPDKSLKAIVFQRDCGATTGFSTQISIIGANEELKNNAGNIFVMMSRYNQKGPINLNWENNKQLNIQHSLNGKEDRAEDSFGLFNSIKITYRD